MSSSSQHGNEQANKTQVVSGNSEATADGTSQVAGDDGEAGGNGEASGTGDNGEDGGDGAHGGNSVAGDEVKLVVMVPMVRQCSW